MHAEEENSGFGWGDALREAWLLPTTKVEPQNRCSFLKKSTCKCWQSPRGCCECLFLLDSDYFFFVPKLTCFPFGTSHAVAGFQFGVCACGGGDAPWGLSTEFDAKMQKPALNTAFVTVDSPLSPRACCVSFKIETCQFAQTKKDGCLEPEQTVEGSNEWINIWKHCTICKKTSSTEVGLARSTS